MQKKKKRLFWGEGSAGRYSWTHLVIQMENFEEYSIRETLSHSQLDKWTSLSCKWSTISVFPAIIENSQNWAQELVISLKNS